jgi:nucleoside-diphosphate-sugar epimerase
LTWIAGAAGLVGLALYRRVRARGPAPAVPSGDPRAQELRRKLDESRSLLEERDEFEAAETPVDEADAAAHPVEERRRRVHEGARAAARQMRSAADRD